MSDTSPTSKKEKTPAMPGEVSGTDPPEIQDSAADTCREALLERQLAIANRSTKKTKDSNDEDDITPQTPWTDSDSKNEEETPLLKGKLAIANRRSRGNARNEDKKDASREDLQTALALPSDLDRHVMSAVASRKPRWTKDAVPAKKRGSGTTTSSDVAGEPEVVALEERRPDSFNTYDEDMGMSTSRASSAHKAAVSEKLKKQDTGSSGVGSVPVSGPPPLKGTTTGGSEVHVVTHEERRPDSFYDEEMGAMKCRESVNRSVGVRKRLNKQETESSDVDGVLVSGSPPATQPGAVPVAGISSTNEDALTALSAAGADAPPPTEEGGRPMPEVPTAFVVEEAPMAEIVKDRTWRNRCLLIVALLAITIAAILGILAGKGAFATPTSVSDLALTFAPTLARTDVPTAAPTLSPTHACPWTKIIPSDGNRSLEFGDYLAFDGDTALIASKEDDDKGEKSGSAYVYVRNEAGGWELEQKLTASDGAEGDEFGESVDLDGDTAIIGAEFDDENGMVDSGSAFIFVRTGTSWEQQAKLLPSAMGDSDWFGTSVAIDKDTAVVGASGHDGGNGSESGAAWVFVRSALGMWEEQFKLVGNDTFTGSRFGVGVAVDGETAVVGADFDFKGLDNIGAAYIFTRNGVVWEQQEKLMSDSGRLGVSDSFGHSVAIDGDIVVIGADEDDVNGHKSGSAYVFVRTGNTWNLQAKLVPHDGDKKARFGRVVAVDGDTIVIGAYGDEDERGAAYVFTQVNTTWVEQVKLVPNVGEGGDEGDRFGNCVGVSGGMVLAGAKRDDGNGRHSGAAYTIELCE